MIFMKGIPDGYCDCENDDTISINVKMPDGVETFPLVVGKCENIGVVKFMIQIEKGVFRLAFDLFFLEQKFENHRNLSHYSVEDGSVIRLVLFLVMEVFCFL